MSNEELASIHKQSATVTFRVGIAQIITGLLTAGSLIYYAGKDDAKIDMNTTSITKHEESDGIIHTNINAALNKLDDKIVDLNKLLNPPIKGPYFNYNSQQTNNTKPTY